MLIVRLHSVVLILALLACGCQEFLPAPPRPSQMVPSSAIEGEEVAVTIEGANFFPDILISYRDENNSHIRADFSARLEEIDLLEVTYVDSGTLTARVPGTLAPGEYDLTVEDPRGRTGHLARAFTVDKLIECEQDIDCQDPCYSSAACVDNRCVMGEVVKDSDDDGFIDQACPGGDDCDDDPAGCGANCHPGLTDDCDGYDNDCDGPVDNDWTPSTSCGVGVCQADEVCNGQAGTSCTENPPDEASDLTCDGLDGDCDGSTDEDFVPASTTCGLGVCLASGQTDCQAGTEVDICLAGPQNEPSDVTCDGLDGDCDGSTDEDWGPVATCGTGVCLADEVCNGAAGTSCIAGPQDEPSDVTCNGLDGDCDGATDEDYVPTPTNCGTGVCASTGLIECQAGAEVDTCTEGPQNEASDATCDGLDGDCDGATDEEWTPSVTCGLGVCLADEVCNGAAGANCSEGPQDEPSDVTCDGLDGDCDGATDEDWLPGTCGFGVCQADEVCNGSSGVDCIPGPPDEVSEFSCSDNLDNDCDGLTDGADPSCGGTNTPPLPAILVSPGAGETGTYFEASALGTTDREQDPATLTYRWDWANDGTFEDTGQVVNRTLSTAGVYTVVLEVEDAGNLLAYASFVLHVLDTNALIVVTTPEDEEDAGAVPGPDFSLREAIAYTNGLAGHQQILIPDGYVINLTLGTVGDFTDADGVSIIGDGAVLDGQGGGTNCVQINGSNNLLYGLEVRNCPSYAVVVQGGSGNQISRCHLHHNGDGIYFISPANDFGPDNEVAYNNWGLYTVAAINVVGNHFHDNGSVGVRLVNAAGTYLQQNVIIRNGVGIEMGTSCSNSTFYHNTVHQSLGDGMNVFNNAANLDFRNNIISSSGGWAIDGKDGNFGLIEYNDYHNNTTGICSNCTGGTNVLQDNPLYIDPASDDLRLGPDSTLINAGFDLGLDLTGPQPGNYNGTAPDIGYWQWP